MRAVFAFEDRSTGDFETAFSVVTAVASVMPSCVSHPPVLYVQLRDCITGWHRHQREKTPALSTPHAQLGPDGH